MRKWPCLVLGVVLCLAAACEREEVVLKVDGLSVGKEEFLAELHLLTEGERLPLEQLQELKRAVLEDLIDRALVLKEASRRGLSVSDEEVDRVLRRLGADLLPDANVLRERVRALLLRARLIEAMAREMALPSEEELKAYYQEHEEEFSRPERVRARHILVATEEEAKKVLKKLKGKRKTPFEELARVHSIAPEGPEGGDLGYVSPGEVPEEFEVIFDLKEGQVSPIVKSPYGYHIFLVEKREKGGVLPYEEVRGQILLEVMEKKVEEAWQQWLTRRREEADIWVNEGLLKELS